jgi:hypothetical protein
MPDVSPGPFDWPSLEVEIPTTSPAAVGAPPIDSWSVRARAGRAALDGSGAAIGGVPLGELRREARGEALALARAYTRSLGIEPGPGGDRLVLCTGHQPVLCHPGIWVKYLAMARQVPPDGVGLNLIVDSDAVEEVAADVPGEDGRLYRARVVLASAAPDVPAEVMPAPSAGEWRAFAAEIDAHLRTIDDPAVLEGWVRAREVPPPPSHAGLAGAVTALRRRLEGPRPYLDLPVSALADLPAFRRFAMAILRDARRFAQVHNTCLGACRVHYGLRTAAQPFSDLAVEGDLVETPFWYVAASRRWPLFVEPGAGRLVAADQVVGALPEDPSERAFAGMAIRPRALTLTAFARLVVADMFVHGVGGARYDCATDAVIRAFFGVSPPEYATVTATLFLPFETGGSREAERQRLRRALLDLQHNPDRHLPQKTGAHTSLVAEKWNLIRGLEDSAGLSRRERRAATQRIREINRLLQVAVAGQMEEVQEALRRLDRHQEDAEVTAYRGYPFLLFPVEAVERLVDLLAQDRTASVGAEGAP